MHAQASEWGFQLVCGICQKTALCGERSRESFQQVIDGLHQGRHFLRHVAVIKRAQVIWPALAYPLLESVERSYATHQRQPNEQHRERQNDKLWHHHALDNLSGQCRSFLQRLGNLQQREGAATRLCLHPHIGDADVLATDLVVT